jgi:plastocyanin
MALLKSGIRAFAFILLTMTFMVGSPWTGAGPQAKTKTYTIVIEGMKFIPKTLTVERGDTVIWNNKDPFPHTATAQSGFDFDSKGIGVNKAWQFVAHEPGTIPYICTFHPTMKGTLVVK